MEHLLVLVLLVVGPCLAQVDVETVYGTVRGQTILLHDGKSVNSFHGIPYARAPVGDLRWALPEEPDPWELFVADELPNSCPQNGNGIFIVSHPMWNNFSENCLNVQIYTPADMSGGPYPVMVYFHGGAYVSGANIQYPGHFLAARDVVAVVANYRLNAIGFMSAYDKQNEYRGNWGLWDQALSLQFVKRNIHNFGGDPNKVTIFGQSAGASSVGLHQMSHVTRNLFNQAICESGNDMTFWAVNWPAQKPETYTEQIALYLNCTIDDPDVMVACMRAIPWEDIVKARFECTEGHFCQGFAPVIDGPGGFIHDTPHELRKNGDFHKGPLMSGICTEDGSFYTLVLIPESKEGGFNQSEFHRLFRENLLGIWSPQVPSNETVEDVFAAFMFYYTPWPHVDDEEANRWAFNEIITDGGFGFTADDQMKQHAAVQEDTYFYHLGYRTTNATRFVPEWMGVPHMGEIPYVFGWPLLQFNRDVRKDSGIRFDILDWNSEDVEYAEFYLDMWTNFAKYGNPTPLPIQAPLGNGFVTWPKYNNQTYGYLSIAREIYAGSELLQRSYALFQEYIPYITGRSLDPLPLSEVDNEPPTKRGGGRVATSVYDVMDILFEDYRDALLGIMEDYDYDY